MLKVGEVAQRAGVGVQTIHFYERRGILPQAARSRAGYRKFPEEAVDIVRFVRQVQALGFTLAEIRQLLELRRSRRADCHRVHALAKEKIETVSTKITQLQRIKDALEDLVYSCEHPGEAQDEIECCILEGLANG